ncbi:putative repeat protein (TIGR03843 family) [Kibdelosporangium banguiense]|uniref:Repeat protein (TIGR03843 family) n=1 Tax=Kibdelosporangium banguiense TaxID=1365924 RepID=A0ABS4TSV1_9PSEU|nr:SCO1664 family protein [Kibdelosporangium banguiense]MBP2327479.1 putative repeat protein (TIGR03843 family) [Kibdelosporangium banguiense]
MQATGGPAALELITRGKIDVEGRLVDASNATLYCAINHNGVSAHCVYKPINGERALWDFPDGTLAGREVAAYLVSDASGLGLVPPTVLRPGPFGPGMVQLWIDTKEGDDLVDVLPPDEVPDGWRMVLRAHDRFGDPAVLTHADHPSVKLLAALDIVINNADRKGGHVLHGTDGNVYGVDHGICLHTENKLRTVLWGFLGEPLPEEAIVGLARVRSALDDSLGEQLSEHLTRHEVRALRHRTDALLQNPVYPEPNPDGRPIPWPAF